MAIRTIQSEGLTDDRKRPAAPVAGTKHTVVTMLEGHNPAPKKLGLSSASRVLALVQLLENFPFDPVKV
jgi:hypothetical protein